MLSVLSWLPLIGPIFQTIADAWSKHEDTQLQKQVDTNKTALGTLTTNNQTDVEVIQSRAQVAIAFKDDLGVRMIRDIVMFPIGIWTGGYFYTLTFPHGGWVVEMPPQPMQYIPYAVIAFLFATAYRGR